MFAYLLTLLIELNLFTLPKAGEGWQFGINLLSGVSKVYAKKLASLANLFGVFPRGKGLSASSENAYHFIPSKRRCFL
jgi:hypothetical protein